MKFYATVGDEEYLLLDKSFEDAVVTFWFWNLMRAERGEIPAGAKIRVTELAIAYKTGLIENAEVSLLPVLNGEELREELKAYLNRPAGQTTLDNLVKVTG